VEFSWKLPGVGQLPRARGPEPGDSSPRRPELGSGSAAGG